MSTSRSYFPPRPLGSSNGSATSNPVESNGHRPLLGMRSPNSQQVVHSELRSMCNCSQRVSQNRRYTIPHQEELRQPSANVQRHLPWTTRGTPRRIPQMDGINRREHMRSFTPIAGSVGVDDYPKLVSNHQAVPEHASSSRAVGYHDQTLKRKATITELPLGSPTSVAVESTTNDFFSFANNYQAGQTCSAKKKAMTPLLVNEEDAAEAMERMEREIQFFPQQVAHKLFGKESEFSVYEMSDSCMDGFDAALDLSLNLSSSSSGKSGMAMDLLLMLRRNPCA